MAFDPITFSEVLNNKAPIGSIVRVINSFENPKYVASGTKFDSTVYPILGEQIPGGFQGDYVHEVPFPAVTRYSASVAVANSTAILACWTIDQTVYMFFKNGSLWQSNTRSLYDGINYVKTFVAADLNGIAPTAITQGLTGRSSQQGMRLYLSTPTSHIRLDLNDPTLSTWDTLTMPAATSYFFCEGGGTILANTNTPATVGGVVFSGDDGGSWANSPAVSAAFNYTSPFIYANGIFMSYGSITSNNVIRTANLGTTWTINTACTVGVGSIAYNPTFNLFVATPYSAGAIFTSPDGATWTTRTAVTAGGTTRIAVASNGAMVVYGSNGAANLSVSANATTWVVKSGGLPFVNSTAPAKNQQFCGFVDVFAIDGTLYAMTAPSGANFIIGSADNGTTWTQACEFTNMSTTNVYGPPVVNHDGTVVVLMDNVTMGASVALLSTWTGIISKDSGATWQNIAIPSGTDLVSWKGVLITDDGKYLAYGNIPNVNINGVVLPAAYNGFRTASSDDGITWTYNVAPATTFTALVVTALVPTFASSKTFPNVIVGNSSQTTTNPVSYDYGKTWTVTPTTSANMLIGSFKDKILLMTNGVAPRYFTTNGSSLSTVGTGLATMPQSSTVSSFAADDNLAVITWLNSNLVLYSYDGVTWLSTTLPSPVPGPGAAIINGWVLIPTNGGTLYRTQDFINWEQANIGDDVKYSMMAISSIVASGDGQQGYYNGATASSTAGYILRAATEETTFRRVPLINSDLPNTKWVVIAK